MAGLVGQAKSQHSIEKQIREIGGGGVSFVTAYRPEPLAYGRRAGRRVRQVGRVPEDRGPRQPRADVEHGPGRGFVEPHALHKGTLLENVGGAGPGGGLVPPFYEPGIVDKLFEPLGVADVFGQSTVSASPGPLRRRGHRHERRCRCGRGRARSPSRRSATRRRRGDSEDRHGAPDLGRDARGRTVDPVAT